VETTQEQEKGTLLLNNSPRGRAYSQWRANGEQTLLSATLQFAVASRWRANTTLCHVVAHRGEHITRRGEL